MWDAGSRTPHAGHHDERALDRDRGGGRPGPPPPRPSTPPCRGSVHHGLRPLLCHGAAPTERLPHPGVLPGGGGAGLGRRWAGSSPRSAATLVSVSSSSCLPPPRELITNRANDTGLPSAPVPRSSRKAVWGADAAQAGFPPSARPWPAAGLCPLAPRSPQVLPTQPAGQHQPPWVAGALPRALVLGRGHGLGGHMCWDTEMQAGWVTGRGRGASETRGGGREVPRREASLCLQPGSWAWKRGQGQAGSCWGGEGARREGALGPHLGQEAEAPLGALGLRKPPVPASKNRSRARPWTPDPEGRRPVPRRTAAAGPGQRPAPSAGKGGSRVARTLTVVFRAGWAGSHG